jgi:hypothetical protein
MANGPKTCSCGSVVSYLNVELTCGVCGAACCEQCGTPIESKVLCKQCADKYRQINLLPEPPEDEDDF